MDARQRWTLILTSVAALMVSLDMLVVTTALNTIRLDLGASIAELDWTINAYTLTVGVLLLTAAAAGDRLGRRRMLVAGLVTFTAASAGCALAPSISVLILGRALQGVGTAMVLPQALALLAAAFPPAERGRAMGLFAGITGLAVVAEAIGTASGVYNALRQVGSTFGVAIGSVVFAATGSFASPLAVTHG